MSYRIHLGIVKIKDLKDHLNKDFSYIKDEDDRGDAEKDFFYNMSSTELHDCLDLEQFKVIKKYKDDEYAPYRLNKKDFQKILDYYKKLCYDNFKEKEEQIKKFNEEEKEFTRDFKASVDMNYYYISSYFKGLIKSGFNITSSGMFFIDYFYLVRLFENMKRDECIIITHG